MNPNMIWSKNETEDLLLSMNKNCETVVKQIYRKAEGTLELKLTQPTETFFFNAPISIEGCWMPGLTGSKIYNSIFNISDENIKFEVSTDNFDEFPFEELKDDLEEIFIISDIPPSHVQDEKIGPRIFQVDRN